MSARRKRRPSEGTVVWAANPKGYIVWVYADGPNQLSHTELLLDTQGVLVQNTSKYS
jgi:hypothetical protein